MQSNLSTAVIGYGSLMNNLQSKNYHNGQRHGPTLQVHLDNSPHFSSLTKVGAEGEKLFRIDTTLQLPVSLKGKSGIGTENRRFTRVIDPEQGIPARSIAYAISNFRILSETISNVAAREGANSPELICYLTRDQISNGRTTIVTKDNSYKGNIGVLTEDHAKKIAEWADRHGFGSVVWASFAVKTTPNKRTQELQSDPKLLDNTKKYIRDIPFSLLSNAEKAILEM
jgi:hypothetical protein